MTVTKKAITKEKQTNQVTGAIEMVTGTQKLTHLAKAKEKEKAKESLKTAQEQVVVVLVSGLTPLATLSTSAPVDA